jgi:hypothetical protein
MLRRCIKATAWMFVLGMIVNTIIALRYGWPAEFDAPGDPDTITTDFILHGTRISPPLHALVIIASAGWLATYRGWRGIAAIVVLLAYSVLVTVAAAGEPAGLPHNNVPRLVWLILGGIGRYAPILLILFGAAELIQRAWDWKHSKDSQSVTT